MSDHKSTATTTGDMLRQQLDAQLENAAEILDHVENFDEHRQEIEDGTREPDDWMSEDTTEEYELRERWQEGILSIERKVTFEFWFTLGGPNVWAEVTCNAEKRQGWTAYDIEDIWLHGAWGSDKDLRPVYSDHPLWKLIEQEVESMGESEG